MANYHYVSNGQAQGPIPEADLDQLISNGSLTREALIWTEGMPEWQPYATVRGGASGAGGPAVALATAPPVAGGLVCGVCQQTFPPDQVIRYGAHYVCGNCKPQFLQRLREGGQIGAGLEYARFGKRFMAKIVDTFAIYFVTLGLDMIISAGSGTNARINPAFALLLMAVNLTVSFAYPIFFLGKWGQTLGKMAAGIKVVTPEGTSISYGKAAGRVLAEIVTGFTFGIGYLMVLWDPERRALHDRIAGTRVIVVLRS
jgi:uncharacterized RDD family membrane protein YckC